MQINSKVAVINKEILEEKKKEKIYKEKLGIYTGQNNTSQILIDDFKGLYFKYYVSNITLLIGVAVISRLLFTIYRKPT
jgi:hypothetical protein